MKKLIRNLLVLLVCYAILFLAGCGRNQTNPKSPAIQSFPPTIPADAEGPDVFLGKDRIKTEILARIKSGTELPMYYTSSIFYNPNLDQLPFSLNAVIADVTAGNGPFIVYTLNKNLPFKKIVAVERFAVAKGDPCPVAGQRVVFDRRPMLQVAPGVGALAADRKSVV